MCIRDRLEVKEKDIVDALDSTQSVLSIFEPVYNSDGDELFLLDQIKDDKDEIERLNNLMALKRSLTRLKGKELDIIQKRYYQDMTQTEIAGELGISQAQDVYKRQHRSRRIRRATRRLRNTS